MAKFDLLIMNGVVVTDTETCQHNIPIKGEKIVEIAPRSSFFGVESKLTIDAKGGYVMSGGIDAHCHLAEPALFGKGKSADDYETGSRLAIAGGTTTIITFASQRKSEPSLLAALKATQLLAANQCYPDYSFHMICSNAGPKAASDFSALSKAGISSLKIYITYEALQLKDDEIFDVLLEAQKKGLPVYAETCPQYLFLTKKDLDKPGFEGAKCVCSPPLREGEQDHESGKDWRMELSLC